MTGRALVLILCIFVLNVSAQNAKSPYGDRKSAEAVSESDPLLDRLKAAENHQISGDLTNAAIENRNVLGIALQRLGNVAIEEGKYADAVRILTESLKFEDSAPGRTNLAVAYLRQQLFDKALIEARKAVAIDPNHIGARYILANIQYSKEDYKAALPELEYVFAKAPDFEIARSLGLTYLNLKQIENARAHFEKIRLATRKPDADLHFLLAKFYERTSFPDDAERELRKALELEPKKPKLNFYLGYLLLQNGGSDRLEEAGAAFEQELKLTPRDFSSLFFVGVAASAENDHRKAIDFLARAIEINPKSGEAHLFLGQSQLELGDFANAEKNLRIAVTLEENGGKNTQARRTHFMLGRLLVKTGRTEEGQKELKIAAELQKKSLDSSRDEIDRILGQVAEKSDANPSADGVSDQNLEIKLPPEKIKQLKEVREFLTNVIAQAYNNLGVISTQNKMLGEAVENFSSAYGWMPDFPNLARNFGILSFRANDFEKAIVPLSKHIAQNPSDLLIRKMLASSYYLTKNFVKVVETLKPISADLTGEVELMYFYGISMVQLKRNQEAVPIFSKLAEASQQNPEALFYAAQGFMMLGDYEKSVREFRQVALLNPNLEKANYFMGQSLIRLSRFDEAEKAFTRELEIDPTDVLSKYHLALTLIERKIDTERTIKILEEAISLKYDYADASYQLGKIYLEKGETPKAIEKLERAASSDPKKDYIHYQLSIAYRKMQRKEDADREMKIYQKLKAENRKMETLSPMGSNENPPK